MKIAVAMMVKNEAANLPRCLASLNALKVFDEIVIVDTGSTDDTVAIAREHGARVVIPEDIDSLFIETQFGKSINFSAGRNLTIDAAADADWLFLVDADEEILGASDRLRKFLETQPKNVESAALEFNDYKGGEKVMQFLSPRIFRKGCVRFVNIVHNRPVFKEPAVYFPDLKIKHHGFDLTPEQRQVKRARTLGLLLKQLEIDPASHWCHFYLAQIYGEDQDYAKTIEAAAEYIAHRDEVFRFNPAIYYTIAQACLLSKDKAAADKWIGQAIRELPDDMDIACAVADYGALTENPGVMVTGCEMYLAAWAKIEADPISLGARFIYNRNEKTLARVLFQLALQRLHAGTNHLTRLKNIVAKMPDREFAETVEKDVAREFGKIGISWVHHEGKPAETKVVQFKQKQTQKVRRGGKWRNCKRR